MPQPVGVLMLLSTSCCDTRGAPGRAASLCAETCRALCAAWGHLVAGAVACLNCRGGAECEVAPEPAGVAADGRQPPVEGLFRRALSTAMLSNALQTHSHTAGAGCRVVVFTPPHSRPPHAARHSTAQMNGAKYATSTAFPPRPHP